jgi:hypothetical protein
MTSRVVLATELIRRDHHGSRRPTVVDVKPAEHAHDRDRLGRVDGRHMSRRYALVQALVRAALVEIALVSAQKRGEVLVVDEQHMVEQLSAYTGHKALGHGIQESRQLHGVRAARPHFASTHPFHPLHGHEFELVDRRQAWGEDPVYYQAGREFKKLPATWMSAAAVPPFVALSVGRALFRTEDLLALVALIYERESMWKTKLGMRVVGLNRN